MAKKTATKRTKAAKTRAAAGRGTRKTAVPSRKKPAPKTPARTRVPAVPPGFGTLTMHLVVSDGNAAMEFYKRAFGAREQARMTAPDGALVHGEVKIGSSIVMIGAETPGGPKSPSTLGGSGATINLYVKNADATFAQAVAAGATVGMPLGDQFWGDRYGQVVDPFGHTWPSRPTSRTSRPKSWTGGPRRSSPRWLAARGETPRGTENGDAPGR